MQPGIMLAGIRPGKISSIIKMGMLRAVAPIENIILYHGHIHFNMMMTKSILPIIIHMDTLILSISSKKFKVKVTIENILKEA